MLSLKYYGIVHRADIDDYMRSLRFADELDKNDFRHLMYAVKVKPTEEALALPEIRRTIDATSEFDDNEEVQEQKVAEQHRRKVCDVEMSLVDPTTIGTIAQNCQRQLSTFSFVEARARRTNWVHFLWYWGDFWLAREKPAKIQRSRDQLKDRRSREKYLWKPLVIRF
jgi:hypothetical protein